MSFTEKNLVPNAGLLPAAVLAQRIGLGELIDQRLKLAEHGANSGAKALTVIGSALLRCSIAGHAEAGPGVRVDQMAGLSSSNAVANRNTRVASTASS